MKFIKLSIQVLVVVATLQSAFGQGTFFFNNLGNPTGRVLFSANGSEGPASGSLYKIDLMVAGHLESTFTNAWLGSGAQSGYFDAGAVAIPNHAVGSSAFVQIRVYRGPSWTDGFFPLGQSDSYQVTFGSADAPSNEFSQKFRGLVLVPEPSTWAMAGVGIVGGFFVLRSRNMRRSSETKRRAGA